MPQEAKRRREDPAVVRANRLADAKWAETMSTPVSNKYDDESKLTWTEPTSQQLAMDVEERALVEVIERIFERATDGAKFAAQQAEAANTERQTPVVFKSL